MRDRRNVLAWVIAVSVFLLSCNCIGLALSLALDPYDQVQAPTGGCTFLLSMIPAFFLARWAMRRYQQSR